MAARPLSIGHLCDDPDARARLVAWFEAEWAPWYGPNGDGDARADLAACTQRDKLPICLIARIASDGELAGTAALKRDALGSELGLGPWLAALLIGPAYRGQGIATALVAAIEGLAMDLGFSDIYCAADEKSTLLVRRGWQPVDTVQSLRGPVAVLRWRPSGRQRPTS